MNRQLWSEGDPRVRRLGEKVYFLLRPRKPLLPSFLFWAALVPLILAATFVAPGLGGFGPVILGPTIGFGLGAAAVLLTRHRVHARATPVIATMLAEGFCPSCGYNLHGLGTESDGCISCPECGGAWRANRVSRTAPFAEHAAGSKVTSFGMVVAGLDASSGLDDRGRAVIVSPRRLRSAERGTTHPEHRTALCRARGDIRPSGQWLRVATSALLLCIGIAGAVFIAFIWRQIPGLPPGLLLGAITGSLTFFALAFGVWFGHFGYSRRVVVSSYTSRGCCASCGADLRRLPVDPEGCTICPECGAAWLLACGARP
jgi:hypothetical protein